MSSFRFRGSSRATTSDFDPRNESVEEYIQRRVAATYPENNEERGMRKYLHDRDRKRQALADRIRQEELQKQAIRERLSSQKQTRITPAREAEDEEGNRGSTSKEWPGWEEWDEEGIAEMREELRPSPFRDELGGWWQNSFDDTLSNLGGDAKIDQEGDVSMGEAIGEDANANAPNNKTVDPNIFSLEKSKDGQDLLFKIDHPDFRDESFKLKLLMPHNPGYPDNEDCASPDVLDQETQTWLKNELIKMATMMILGKDSRPSGQKRSQVGRKGFIPRRNIPSNTCSYLLIQNDNRNVQWTVQKPRRYACRQCVNAKRPCILHISAIRNEGLLLDTKILYLLPVPMELRKRTGGESDRWRAVYSGGRAPYRHLWEQEERRQSAGQAQQRVGKIVSLDGSSDQVVDVGNHEQVSGVVAEKDDSDFLGVKTSSSVASYEDELLGHWEAKQEKKQEKEQGKKEEKQGEKQEEKREDKQVKKQKGPEEEKREDKQVKKQKGPEEEKQEDYKLQQRMARGLANLYLF